MKKWIALALICIAFLSLSTLATLSVCCSSMTGLTIEIGKSALQLLIVSVIGTTVSLLVFEYQRERQATDRATEQARQASDRTTEQARQASEKQRDLQQKRFEYRESLLTSVLSRTMNAYSKTKKARRMTRAHMTLIGTVRQLSLNQYDTFFDLINEAQLELENLKRDIRTSAKAFSDAKHLTDNLQIMDDYLGHLIGEYEVRRQKFIGIAPTLPLVDLPLLENFLGPAASSDFKPKMIEPYSAIQAVIREDLLHPNLP